MSTENVLLVYGRAAATTRRAEGNFAMFLATFL